VPQRLVRSRQKGYRLPEGSVYVGRPTKWGNPFRIADQADAVAVYRYELESGRLRVTVEEVRRELAGLDLVCWCAPGQPCHADVLMEIANS
jgi:hypothetical protein